MSYKFSLDLLCHVDGKAGGASCRVPGLALVAFHEFHALARATRED